MNKNDIKPLAFYLPQFHPIDENDKWWGKGFTEWTNVTKSKPKFNGHYQPHLPSHLGFYDLRLHETMVEQAEMAKRYGIHGFLFYHYWFNGKRILNRPVDQWIEKKTPDFPFCLCWANENWTRRWDGLDEEVLLFQNYSNEDDLEHIKFLIPIFSDKRYIKINGKPLIFIYRTELLKNPEKTAEIWRRECKKAGFPDVFLVRLESHSRGLTPANIGFDAAGEFAPDWKQRGEHLYSNWFNYQLKKLGIISKEKLENRIYSYETLVENMLSKEKPDYKLFRGVCPSWDNSARRKTDATIFLNSSPELYGKWLQKIIKQTIEIHSVEEQFILINAWNEWAEGCHLEPDQKYGLKYLEETKKALEETGFNIS